MSDKNPEIIERLGLNFKSLFDFWDFYPDDDELDDRYFLIDAECQLFMAPTMRQFIVLERLAASSLGAAAQFIHDRYYPKTKRRRRR